MSVVAGAAAFTAEPLALVETDGGGVPGADFQGKVVGVVGGSPGEEGPDEGGGDALAAGFGEDGDGVELAEVLSSIDEKSRGGEGLDFFFRGGDQCGSEEVGVGSIGGEVGSVVGRLPLRVMPGKRM
jgi:hypothetical protein